MLIEETSSVVGKMSAAAKKIGGVKMRIVVVKKSGIMLIRSASALRNA
jgi:hypothetical protein